MTGFLFGLGLTIMVGQLPSLIGVEAGDGNVFPRVADLLGSLGDAHGATVAVGAGGAGGDTSSPPGEHPAAERR